MYRSDLLDKIAQENATAEERVKAAQQPDEDRYKSKLDALWNKGVSYQLFNILVELRFSIRSWAFLEENDILNVDEQTKVLLFAMASTLHETRVEWTKLLQNGFQIDEEFQKACMEAWEMSKPLPPTCPPDPISARVMSKKPKPTGLGIDYMGMMVSLCKMFGWSKDEFWAMSPREIGLILDENNWDVHYQNLIEKEHMKKGGK